VDVYHVPNLSVNLLFVAQLTQTCKIVEFWLNRFYFHDLKKGKSIFIGGLLDSIDSLYKFHDLTQIEPEPTTLVAHTKK